MNKHTLAAISRIILLGGALAAAAGCAATHQAREAKASGFLGDYSQLRPGESGEALWNYVNPAADFRGYDKIAMEPARLYSSKNGDLAKISKEDQQNLVNYLHATVYENLKGDYTFVRENGPGAMRLRMAITDAETANVALDTISTVLPIGLAVSGIKRLATGTPSAVGKAGIEMELVDSQTGVRLAAAIDRRFGEKVTGNLDKFDPWRAVTDSFDFWAGRLKTRLAELKAGGRR